VRQTESKVTILKEKYTCTSRRTHIVGFPVPSMKLLLDLKKDHDCFPYIPNNGLALTAC